MRKVFLIVLYFTTIRCVCQQVTKAVLGHLKLPVSSRARTSKGQADDKEIFVSSTPCDYIEFLTASQTQALRGADSWVERVPQQHGFHVSETAGFICR